jgi:hypothetical protein
VCWSIAAFAQSPALPDLSSLLDPLVTPETINLTICEPYYADRSRIPVDEILLTKRRLALASGLSPDTLNGYALERRVPVILGGSATSSANLRLRRWDGIDGERRRALATVSLRDAVCAGQVGLRKAQSEIFQDWRQVFKHYVHAPRTFLEGR